MRKVSGAYCGFLSSAEDEVKSGGLGCRSGIFPLPVRHPPPPSPSHYPRLTTSSSLQKESHMIQDVWGALRRAPAHYNIDYSRVDAHRSK